MARQIAETHGVALPDAAIETLDLAVNGADLPNAVQRVRHFIDECRSAM